MSSLPKLVVLPSASSAWILLSVGLTLPWLMPIHQRPWTGFHADALMTLTLVVLTISALVFTKGAWKLPASGMIVFAVACIPPLQNLAGLIPFGSDAFLASGYLLAFSFSILVGSRIESVSPAHLAPTVFASFGLAAAASSAIALNQWLQLDQWGSFTIAIGDGARPVANVAQPNKLATLYAWGLISGWWAFRSGLLRGWLALIMSSWLLFSISMTQSRMAFIAICAILMLEIVRRDRSCAAEYRIALAALLIFFLSCTWGWSSLNDRLALAAPQTLEERLKPGTRLLHWQLMLDAISQRPLFGWGWQQVSVAQAELALDHPPTGEIIRFSHNIVIDLLVWNGVPLGVLLLLGMLIWFVRRCKATKHPVESASIAILAVFAWHAMLEFPHGSLVVLVPAGLLVGGLICKSGRVARGYHPSPYVFGIIVFIVGLSALYFSCLVRDYFRLEAAWVGERMRIARIGDITPLPLPDTPTLSHLRAVLVVSRTDPYPGMSVAQIEFIRDTTYRMPSVSGLRKLALAQALNGQRNDALESIARLCRVKPYENCLDAEVQNIKAATLSVR